MEHHGQVPYHEIGSGTVVKVCVWSDAWIIPTATSRFDHSAGVGNGRHQPRSLERLRPEVVVDMVCTSSLLALTRSIAEEMSTKSLLSRRPRDAGRRGVNHPSPFGKARLISHASPHTISFVAASREGLRAGVGVLVVESSASGHPAT